MEDKKYLSKMRFKTSIILIAMNGHHDRHLSSYARPEGRPVNVILSVNLGDLALDV